MVLGGAVSPPTTSNLQQQLRDLDDKHDTAHDRLRKDVDALAIELSSARELAVAVRNDLNVAIARQTNISAIGFSTNQVIAVVVTALALAGGFYKLAQNQAETTAAIQRLQTDSTRSIERQELQRQQIESLQNAVLLQKGTK
jgi:hypothetical protein